MIQRKDGQFSLPGLKRHTEEVFPFMASWKARELFQDY